MTSVSGSAAGDECRPSFVGGDAVAERQRIADRHNVGSGWPWIGVVEPVRIGRIGDLELAGPNDEAEVRRMQIADVRMTDASCLGAVLELDLQLERQEQPGKGVQQPLRRNQGYDDT